MVVLSVEKVVASAVCIELSPFSVLTELLLVVVSETVYIGSVTWVEVNLVELIEISTEVGGADPDVKEDVEF